MLYLSNAFSISMLPESDGTQNVSISAIKDFTSKDIEGRDVISFVGHADTAALLEKKLGIPVAVNREKLQLKKDDYLIVAQYTGPRLPEGATELPEGAKFKFYLVYLSRPYLSPY